MDDVKALREALMRERQIRAAAEQMLEQKSHELYTLNLHLQTAKENLEKKVESQTAQLAALNELAKRLLRQEDLDDVLWTIVEDTISRLGLEDCVIYLVDENREYLVQRAAYGDKQTGERQIFQPIKIKLGQGVVGKVALTGKALLVNDTREIPDYIVDDAVRLSELAVPIIADEEVIGVIDSEHPLENYYTEEHVAAFTTIAGFVSSKVKNAMLKEHQTLIETELRLQEEKYRNIIANMNLGLLEVDLEETILYANNSFCDISGYSLPELIGAKATELMLKDGDQSIMEEKKAARMQGISDFYEIKVCNKAGENRWWLISGAPQYDSGGRLTGSIGIHLDITAQKHMERELEEAKGKAEASAQAKEDFLANMSHEIRTPLNAITGMIRELSKGDFHEDQRRNIQNAESASQHLLSIVNNILDLSKIEEGELHIDEHPFSLRKTISQTVNILQVEAERKGLDLSTQLDPKIGGLYIGDAPRIRQILLNLVGNAIKFTDNGSVSIRCDLETDHGSRHELSIHVVDTGCGMSKAFMDRVFQKFSQEKNEAHTHTKGSGLGMMVTHKLVDMMNGTIHVRSEQNIGTQVHILLSLPLACESEYDKEYLKEDKGKFGNAKILLVEDNEMNRLVVRNTLADYDIQLIECKDGLEAIEYLENEQVDVILMDLNMPRMNGMEATRMIREKLKLHTPVIALTANAFKKEVERCLKNGMNDYITKPFEEQTLIHILRKYLLQTNLNLNPSAVPNGRIPAIKKHLYDLRKLEEMSRGNQEFVDHMIRLFIGRTPGELKSLQERMEQEDFEGIYAIAHKIKPSIDHLCITALYQPIRELEKLARYKTDPDEIRKLIATVCTILNQVVEELEDIANTPSIV